MATKMHPIFASPRAFDAKQRPAVMTTGSVEWPNQLKDTLSFSPYHDPACQYTTLNSFVARSLVALVDGSVGVTKVSEKCFATQYTNSSVETIVFKLLNTGKCEGSLIEPSGRWTNLPPVGVKGNAGSEALDLLPVYTAIIMQLCNEDTKVRGALDYVLGYIRKTTIMKEEDFRNYCYYISDAVYYSVRDRKIKCTMTGNNIDMLSQSSVANMGSCNGEVLYGNPDILTNVLGVKKTAKKMTFADAKTEFKNWADTQNWSDDEEKLIPVFPDDYPVLPETVKIAHRYVDTHNDRRPMVNFMWRGITSYGKSTGVAMIAALLHMPLLRMTCHSTMETQDFLSQIVPVGNETAGVVKELPTFEEMNYDPIGSFEAMTGESRDDVSSQECLEKYAELATQRASNKLFKQVQSNFVKALEKGYIVEIQEISRIKDAGVLVGINEYDRPGAIIPLVDGGSVVRHPNAMVIYTDNVGYTSCRPIDPSVIRRMSFIIDSYEVSKEDAIE